MTEPTLDEIGKWSEIKLEIIKAYAKPYSQILASQPRLYHLYIDGFAGAGMHISKATKEKVAGSPLNVVSIEPRFREYHLVEIEAAKARHLRQLFATNSAVHIHEGDCNDVVLNQLLPLARYEDYRRAFCLLDPYGLHLDWKVIAKAGEMRSIDLLLNFPIMDMNMNALLRDAAGAKPDQVARMTRFWGDESWKNAAYAPEETLFGPKELKADNDAVVYAFNERLRMIAGFKYVSDPLPMKNSTNAVVYYLVFASNNATAKKIIDFIFNKHRL